VFILYADYVLKQTVSVYRKTYNLLYQWSVLWLMDFNPVKCEFLRITSKKNPIVYQYYIDNSIIKQTTHSKYLGVTIDKRLTWKEHILILLTKLGRLMPIYVETFTSVHLILSATYTNLWFNLSLNMLHLSGTLTVL